MAIPAGIKAPSAPELAGFAGDLSDLYRREAPPWWARGAPTPAILAVDPGELTGLALLVDGRLRVATIRARYSRIDSAFAEGLSAAVAQLRAAPLDRGRIVLVEDTHIGSCHRTPLAALSAARYTGAVIFAATLAGLPCWRVEPGTWQKPVHGRALRRDEGKDAAMSLAAAIYGVPFAVEHEADAALLAYYAAGRHTHHHPSPRRPKPKET